MSESPRTRALRKAYARARHEPKPGEKVALWSSDFTACGCETVAYSTVPCTLVAVAPRHRARCLACGEKWRDQGEAFR